jgi:hypothetical protein
MLTMCNCLKGKGVKVTTGVSFRRSVERVWVWQEMRLLLWHHKSLTYLHGRGNLLLTADSRIYVHMLSTKYR